MKVILFDFFGVLSTPVYKKVIDQFIAEAERPTWMKRLDDLDAGTLSEEQLVADLAKAGGVTEDEIWAVANNAPKVNYELFSYIEEKLKGKYRVGLLTNIPRGLLERIAGEKLPMFDIALVSSDLGLVKPDRKIFEVAIERCEVPAEEILFIDDSEKNIKAASELGINGIVYTDFPSCVSAVETVLAR